MTITLTFDLWLLVPLMTTLCAIILGFMVKIDLSDWTDLKALFGFWAITTVPSLMTAYLIRGVA